MTKVTNRQIFFILVLTLTSYSIVDISRAMAEAAGTGGWFTLLVTALIFSIFAVIIVYLNNMFKGQMIVDYSKQLVGKTLAYAIAIYYVLYFLMIVVFLVVNMSRILNLDFFDKTPTIAMIIISVPIFCYIAYKGINTAARMCEILGLIFLLTGTTVHILMMSQGGFVNVRPVFNPAETGRYFSAMKETIFPFLGIEVLLIIPMGKHNSKKSVKTAFFAILTICALYILVVETCIMKLGVNDILNYSNSLIESIRDMALPFLDFLERMDILFLTIGFMGMYMGISIVFTAITEYLCKVFSKAKRVVIVIILGSLVIILAFLAGMWADFSKTVLQTGIVLGIISTCAIPTVLLIIAKVKKHGA